METFIQGVSVNNSPFISSILAPRLKQRKLPICFVNTINDIPSISAEYSILEGSTILSQPIAIKQKIQAYLNTQAVSIALTMDRNHKSRIELLELGFHYCVEIPIATEIIIKTIENNTRKVQKTTTHFLNDSVATYNAGRTFSYIHDTSGRQFLTNRTKSVYVTTPESRILNYLADRSGFASNNELAYAGWKHFSIKQNTITVAIKNIRSKLEKISLPYKIRSLYGYGYTLEKRISD